MGLITTGGIFEAFPRGMGALTTHGILGYGFAYKAIPYHL
jgi:hypothetical protein